MGASQGASNYKTASYQDEISEAALRATTGGVLETDLSSRVEFNLAVSGLKRKISGFCIVYCKATNDPTWNVVGRTEICSDTANPKWIEPVCVDFNFEVQSRIRLEVYDAKSVADIDNLQLQCFIGSIETFMAVIVNAQGKIWTKTLSHFQKANVGKISIYAEEMSRLKHSIAFTLSGSRLSAKDFFSRKADPFVSIYRANKDVLSRQMNTNPYRYISPAERVPIFRTEEKMDKSAQRNDSARRLLFGLRPLNMDHLVYAVLKRNLNPQFSRIEIGVQQLCKGEESRPVIMEIWDWNRTQDDKFMGYAETSYSELHRAFQDKKPVILQLMNPLKDQKRKKGQKLPMLGCLHLEDVEIIRKYSFLDYVRGGLDIGLAVAIDFTRSNGDPRLAESLHYHDTAEPNEYVMAIRSVGEILEHYDTDKAYPVFGFGAKLPPSRTVASHIFSLKGDFFDPEVQGISGILSAYRDVLKVVTLHGPTIFHEVIEHVGKIAEVYSSPTPTDPQYKYFILLIVTDGVINDMQQTINAIVKCSEYPMSIIIVGVGEEDFSLMDELDADKEPLYSTAEKKYMTRDIVQFVPFADFKDKSYLELAKATLEEVPGQVVSYFLSKNCPPKDQTYSTRPTTEYQMENFLKNERSKLISSGVGAGYHRNDIEEICEFGIPANDMNILVDILSHTNFRDKTKGNLFQQYAGGVGALVDTKKSAKLVRTNTMGEWGSSTNAVPGTVDEPEGPAASVQLEKQNTPDDFTAQLRGNEAAQKFKKKKKRSSISDVDNLCKVCFENVIDTVLLECGHQVVCDACSADIGALCPLCRQTISRIVRTYNP